MYSKVFSPNLERIGLMIFDVPENDPREIVEEEKKKIYEKEFKLAERVGIVEFLSSDEYEVNGMPEEILEAPDKEIEERYAVWKATRFGLLRNSGFNNSFPTIS